MKVVNKDKPNEKTICRPWSAETKATKAFKETFREWAFKNQNGRCCYCQLKLGRDVRRSIDIDHFIPKNETSSTRPFWRYEPLNLLLSCSECNQSIKKNFEPIDLGETKGSYRKNRKNFSIVHPYFENVRKHISGGFRGEDGTPSPIRWRTEKGKLTVDLLDLKNMMLLRIWQDDHRAETSDNLQLSASSLNRVSIIMNELS